MFQDRLINDEDRQWFTDLLRMKIAESFRVNPAEALGTTVILFGDFIDPQQDNAPYVQMKNLELVS